MSGVTIGLRSGRRLRAHLARAILGFARDYDRAMAAAPPELQVKIRVTTPWTLTAPPGGWHVTREKRAFRISNVEVKAGVDDQNG